MQWFLDIHCFVAYKAFLGSFATKIRLVPKCMNNHWGKVFYSAKAASFEPHKAVKMPISFSKRDLNAFDQFDDKAF